MRAAPPNPAVSSTRRSPDRLEKLKILGQESQYDVCLSTCSGSGGRTPHPEDPIHRWIYPAALPGGKVVPILKILLSNSCRNDCRYCFNRASVDRPRHSLAPEEFAAAFMDLYRSRRVHGLFLSSGIYSHPDRVMEDMIKTAEILRRKHRYPDYLHLKIIPGASRAAIEQACGIADRVSLNLEAPNRERLPPIAPGKDFSRDLLARMRWCASFIEQGSRSRNQTTQFVVGASSETDREILETAGFLYRDLHLHRAYYSGFQPLEGTPLEHHPPTPRVREHRLYQADFLFRLYSFTIDEIAFLPDGNLDTLVDPKTSWARNHPERFPIEINRAEYEELIRIPGIGIRSARRIISARRHRRFSDHRDLGKIRISIKRAAPFILINGKQVKKPTQMSLEFLRSETAPVSTSP